MPSRSDVITPALLRDWALPVPTGGKEARGTVLVVGSGEWLRFLDQPLQFFGHDLGAYPGLRMVVFSLLLLIIMLFAREGLLGKKEIWQTGRRSGGYGGK